MMANVVGMTRVDSLMEAHAMQDLPSQDLITNYVILTRTTWLAEPELRARRDGGRIVHLNFTGRL